MADITNHLNTITNGVYGEDVRQAIHDAIEACYTDDRPGGADLKARQQINQILANMIGSNTYEQVLWEGELNIGGDTSASYVNLSSYPSQFPYVLVYFKTINTGAPEIRMFKGSDFEDAGHPVVITSPFLESNGTRATIREMHIKRREGGTNIQYQLYYTYSWILDSQSATDNDHDVGRRRVINSVDAETQGLILTKITGFNPVSDSAQQIAEQLQMLMDFRDEIVTDSEIIRTNVAAANPAGSSDTPVTISLGMNLKYDANYKFEITSDIPQAGVSTICVQRATNQIGELGVGLTSGEFPYRPIGNNYNLVIILNPTVGATYSVKVSELVETYTTHLASEDYVNSKIDAVKTDLSYTDNRLSDEIKRAKAEETRIENLFRAPTQTAVNNWLNNHPEATTTVQDNSLTLEKMTADLRKSITSAQFVDRLNLEKLPLVHLIPDGNYTSSQGICIVDNYLVVTRFYRNTSPTRYYVVDIAARTVIGMYEYTTGHSNCITYANGYIYAANNTILHKIPFENGVMGQETTITLPQSVTACAYDSETGRMYYRLAGDGNTRRIVSADAPNFNVFTTMFDAVTALNGVTLTVQGMGCDGNYIFLPTSGADYVERILIYSKDGLLLKIFEIPRGTFGEIEDLDFHRGTMVVNFTKAAYGNSVFCVPYLMDTESTSINSIFKLYRAKYDFSNPLVMYVRSDSSYLISFPDGTADHPFNSIAAAIYYVTLIGVPAELHISGTFPALNLYNTSVPIYLVFEDATVTKMRISRCSQITTTGTVTIGELTVENCSTYIVGGGINFINDADQTLYYPIVVYRGILTGTVGTISNYANAVRGLGAIVNLGATLNNVPNMVTGTNNNVTINGTRI